MKNTTTERSELMKTIEKTNMNLNKTQQFPATTGNTWTMLHATKSFITSHSCQR